MTKQCSICNHDDRALIDAELLAGTPLRAIVAKHGVSLGALSRHQNQHLTGQIAKAQDERDILSADNALSELSRIKDELREITAELRDDGQLRGAAASLELQGKQITRLIDACIRVEELRRQNEMAAPITIRWEIIGEDSELQEIIEK